MNYRKLIEKSWQYVRTYRALWIFGVFVALTTASWETWSLYGLNDEDRQSWLYVELSPGEDFPEAFRNTLARETSTVETAIQEANAGLERAAEEFMHIDVEADILSYLIGLAIALTVGYLLSRVLGYLSRAALIRMVDDYEVSETRRSIQQGFRFGWSGASWRLFVIDLVIGIPLTILGIGVLALFGAIIIRQMMWISDNAVAGLAALAITVIIFTLVIVMIVSVCLGAAMAMPLIRRACVIDNLGVLASVRRGVSLARTQFRSIGPVWLFAAAVRVAWPLFVAPIILLLAVVGVLLGGLAAVLVGGISYLLDSANAVILASLFGSVIALLLLTAGASLAGGLAELFLSTLWTLTYRELKGFAPQNKKARFPSFHGEAGMNPATSS